MTSLNWFSYFYHGAPADYWRFTPDALKLIFSELKPLTAEFYGKNRRRDNRGSDVNAVDRDGGPEFAVDAFGGWRENWFSIYVGQKDDEYLRSQIKRAETQVIINLMKHLEVAGFDQAMAAKKVQSIIASIVVNQDEEITVLSKPLLAKVKAPGLKYTRKKIEEIWNKRGSDGIKVSYSRFVMAKKVGL